MRHWMEILVHEGLLVRMMWAMWVDERRMRWCSLALVGSVLLHLGSGLCTGSQRCIDYSYKDQRESMDSDMMNISKKSTVSENQNTKQKKVRIES